MSNSSSYTQDNTDVNRSICPAGWMLPKSCTTDSLIGPGSFIYLKNRANLSAGPSGNIHTAPNWFVYGGGWNNSGHFSHMGDYGNYWSNVAYKSTAALQLFFGSYGGTSPHSGSDRFFGYSVRCVVRPE